jgi:xanthine dehydrogenase accessory factor
MSVDAARALGLVVETVERGGSAVTVTVVSASAAGRRLVGLRQPDGRLEPYGSLGSPWLDEEATALVRTLLDDSRSRDGLRTLTDGPREVEVFVEVRRPVPDLVIVGAGHIARPMSRLGSMLGFRVWVLDDRPEFATRERFPEATFLIRASFDDPFRDVPVHAGSHVLLVTRGHRFDYDCLLRVLALDPPPAYIGMIGSRRRVRATFARLLEENVPHHRLEEVHAPVGLDIGAETPEEIAVAVAAELVATRRGGTGAPLRDVERVTDRFFHTSAEPEEDP